MNLDQFVAKYDGVRVTAPGGIGGQCVDLVNEYVLEVFGFPHEWKNAIDWFGVDPAHYDWVRNDPKDLNQIPPRGSLMVWGPDSAIGTGGLGHLDIVLSAGPQSFVGFDQNWPLGANAHHVAHSYAGVIGWGVPKVQELNAPPPLPVPIAPPPPKPAPVTPAPVTTTDPPPPTAPAVPPAPSQPPIQEVPPVAVNPPPDPPVPVIVPPEVPLPAVVAEAGVTTSEWKLVIGYVAQAAAIGTADLVNLVSQAIFHASVSIPPAQLTLIVGLEFALAIPVVGYAISRAIRKLGAN